MCVYAVGFCSGHGICLSLWNIGPSQAGQDLCADPKAGKAADDSGACPLNESPVTRKGGAASPGEAERHASKALFD